MNYIKTVLKKIISTSGYNISRKTTPNIDFSKFINICMAYEQRLVENGGDILPNETRLGLLNNLRGTQPSEAYFIISALAKCKNLPGDVCEFGVAQGTTSALIANEIASFGNKKLHLFDSFEGLPSPTEKDKLINDIFSLGTIEAYEGTMSCPENMVLNQLEAISFPKEKIEIHKGFIEQLIVKDENLPKEVCFAYVDFDFYEPITVALDYLHNVTFKGSIIIVDDYDFFSLGAKIAVDEFINKNNHYYLNYNCYIPNERYGKFAVITRISN